MIRSMKIKRHCFKDFPLLKNVSFFYSNLEISLLMADLNLTRLNVDRIKPVRYR